MKKGIHPEFKKCVVTCACGTSFETLSNKDDYLAEICSKCHPAYNDKIKTKHKKTGAVEKFNKKFNLNQE